MNKKKIICAAAALIFAIMLPAVFNFGFYLSALVTCVLYMFWASAWNIMGGYAGQFAIGNGMYAGVGAYVGAVLFVTYGVSPWIGMIIAGLIAGILSVIIGYPVFRLKGAYFALTTAALMNVFQLIFRNNMTILGFNTGGAQGLKVTPLTGFANMQFANKLFYYYIILGMLVLILIFSYWITRNKIGFHFRSVSANEEAAASLGIHVLGTKLKAQFISAFLTAMGGVFYAMLTLYVDPKSVFGFDLSITILLMCIVGGVNTLWGPILGAFIIQAFNQVMRTWLVNIAAGYSTVMYGLLLMAVIFFMPGGLLPAIRRNIQARRHKKELALQRPAA